MQVWRGKFSLEQSVAWDSLKSKEDNVNSTTPLGQPLSHNLMTKSATSHCMRLLLVCCQYTYKNTEMLRPDLRGEASLRRHNMKFMGV